MAHFYRPFKIYCEELDNVKAGPRVGCVNFSVVESINVYLAIGASVIFQFFVLNPFCV